MRNCFESFAKSTGGFGQIHRWILQNARVDLPGCTCGFSRMHVCGLFTGFTLPRRTLG